MIKFFADKSLSNWNPVLGMCVAVLNRSRGKTGFSPVQLLFGIQSDYPGSMASFLNDPTSTSEFLRDRIQKRERFTKKRMRLRFWQHAHYNRNRRHIEYSKGQTVYIYNLERREISQLNCRTNSVVTLWIGNQVQQPIWCVYFTGKDLEYANFMYLC